MSDTYLIPQFIIDYLQKSRSTKSPQKLASKLIQKNTTPEIKKWFKENEVTASYIWKFFVFYGLNKFSFRECPVCGKRVNINTIRTNPNAKYCSYRCGAISEESKEKVRETCNEKYGVNYPSQSKEIREKVKETWLEKYGVEHISQSKEIKEKKKQTTLDHYGVENPLQSKDVQEKIKQANFKKYGVENPLQSKEIREKQKQTCFKKYGVPNASQSKEVQEKIFQTNRSNHWESFCSQLKKKDIIPLFSKEEYVNDTGRKFKCLICGKEFESEGTCNYEKIHTNKDGSYTTLSTYHIFCPSCSFRFSKKEKAVVYFLRSIYKGEILENDRIRLEGKELDIYLPQLNIGIEFDGNYWHSKNGAKERDERKNQLCEEKGIRLLRIKETDWDNSQEQIKSQIKSFLGYV